MEIRVDQPVSALADKYASKTVDEVVKEQTKIRQEREKKALIAWANTFLKKRELEAKSLSDFDDGVLLINLLEAAFEDSVGKYSARPKMPIQKLENVSVAFEFMKKKGIVLLSVDTHDIVARKEKQLIIILFLILTRHLFAGLAGSEDAKDEKQGGLRANLLQYLNANGGVSIQDFWDSFKDGIAFCRIVESLCPGHIDVGSLKPEDRVQNLTTAFTVAEEHLQIPRLLDPEDFTDGKKPDEKSVMNYLSMLLSVAQASQKKREMEDRLQNEKRETAERYAQERAAAAQKVEEERRNLEAKNEEVRKLQEQMAHAAKETEEEQRKFQEAQRALAQEMEAERKKQEEEKQRYEEQQQAMQEKIEQEKLKREEEQKIYEALQKNMEQTSNLVLLEKEKNQALEQDAQQLKLAYEQLQEDASKLQEAHLSLQDGTKKLRQAYVDLQAAKDEVHQQHNATSQDLSRLRDQYLDAQKTIEEYRTALDKANATIADLRAQLAAALEEARRLRESLGKAYEELAAARDRERGLNKDIEDLHAAAKAQAEAHAKEVNLLNAEMYRMHREHEEVVERIREEKKKKEEGDKSQNPNAVGLKVIKSMDDKVQAAIRETKSDHDFVNSMRNMEGYLLRRRPNAMFHAARYKKVYYKLYGTKLSYFTDHTMKKKAGKSFALSDYMEALPTSSIPGHFTFKLVPKKANEGENILLEFKAVESVARDPRASLMAAQGASYFQGSPAKRATKSEDDPDRVIKRWMHEFNRRVALDTYLKDVAAGGQPGCKEVLDFICDDTRIALVVEDKTVKGVHQALVSLKKAIDTRPNFQTMALRNISLSDQSLPVVADILKVQTQIQVMELSDNLVTAAGASMLAEALAINQSLLVLDLDNNQLRDGGVEAIVAALPSHPVLRHLSLTGNAITDKGGLALIAALQASQQKFSTPHKMPRLNLRFNLLGDDFVVALAELCKQNPTIRHIDLENNLVTDRGAEALAEAIGSGQTGIRSLLLGSNQISTKGALALEKALGAVNRQFTLDLSNNKLIARKGIAGFVNNEVPMDFSLFKLTRLAPGVTEEQAHQGGLEDDDEDRIVPFHVDVEEFKPPTHQPTVSAAPGDESPAEEDD